MMGDIDALKHSTDARVDPMAELGIMPLVLDTPPKQVQNQVFPCFGKKRNPLDFNGSDARYESRFPLQIQIFRSPSDSGCQKNRRFGVFFRFCGKLLSSRAIRYVQVFLSTA